jgi:Xaa-Pro aminopeptidase
MKHLFPLLLSVFLIAGCKRSVPVNENKRMVPDISDLELSGDQQKVYADRRENLMVQINNGIVILRSGDVNDDERYNFRVADNFYYITGFTEPFSAVAIRKDKSYPTYTLFVKERNFREIKYNGETPKIDDIMVTYRADTVLSYSELPKVIRENVRTGTPIYIDFKDSLLNNDILDKLHKLKSSGKLIKDISPILNEMRVHKDTNEIKRLQKAVDIIGEAFMNSCRICKPSMYEFEIEAAIAYTYLNLGCPMASFPPIIASGPNDVIFHYSANNRKMKEGDLVLIDIGAEYGYYASDITRTIPVNGKFSKEQKDIYELVLEAQNAAISEMKPGNYFTRGDHKSAEVFAQGLFKLGLITDLKSKWQKKFYILYPAINHYIGLYVHDAGDFGVPYSVYDEYAMNDTTFGRTLEKGMVLTVEPGLYFRANGLSGLFELFGKEATHEEIQQFIDDVAPVYEKYKNIGVRIEDDILITDTGCIVLSKNIPREIDEIERIMEKANH